jgi:transcriptional regulator with XRE-family HTH domain
MVTFAQRLKELREANGLSQAALAAAAGMHRLGIAKLEQGAREPMFATAQALARALGVTLLAFADTELAAGEPSGQKPAKRPGGKRGAKTGKK